MADFDYVDLQQKYGGRYVALQDGQVLASADTYDDLLDQLEHLPQIDWDRVIIEYIEPDRSVSVYVWA